MNDTTFQGQVPKQFQIPERELGILWEKTGQNGQYFTGKLHTGESIVIFSAVGRKSDKAPTHKILLSKPKPTNIN